MKKTIRDINVRGKRVLVRVDFNVPLDLRTGAITDDTRIRTTLPTINYLVEHKAKVILCSHLGRPDGKVVEKLRLAPVAERLSKLANLPVFTASNCVGPDVEKQVSELNEGGILMLENLRFHPEEEKNDPDFARRLAELAEVYVNDAFGSAHRAHASTVGITKHLPAVAGFLMERELKVLEKTLVNPERPFCTLIGGAKVSDKLGLLHAFLSKVDSLLIGGGMAATFLKAKGYEVGRSSVEEEKLHVAEEIMEQANWSVTLLLPSDVVVTQEIDNKALSKVVAIDAIPSGCFIVDIGPETIRQFIVRLQESKTVFWNGPVGICEIPQFAHGTRAIAKFLSTLKATTIIGGGSTAEVIEQMGLVSKMTHVSTGGGATLMFLEGKTLPGVEALLDKEQ